MSVLKNYKSTLLLLAGLIAGGVLGAVLGEDASVLQPIGTIFLNLIFVLVVPLVFLSVAQSMVVLRRNEMIGRVLGTSFGVFLFMSLVCGILAYVVMTLWNPFTDVSSLGGAATGGILGEDVNIADAIAGTLTVNDFPLLLSREHLLPLILFAALFGLAVSYLGEKAATIEKLIFEGGAVVMKIMDLVMKLAPIGIGCYFAYTIGWLGGSGWMGERILGNYLQVLLIVCVISAVVFFIINSAYALYNRMPLGKFWKEMIVPAATAVGTCSSAACIPINIAAAQKMGVSEKIAGGVIPIGTNLHKDGSVITAVAKILFTLYMFGMEPSNIGSAVLVILLALVVSIVVGAIPVGGMTGELLICAVLGVDPSFAASLLIIGTICDIPATLVNSTGNLVAATLVDRLTTKKQ